MPPAPITCLECGETATHAGRCRDHHLAQRRRHDQRRPTARERGYGTRWRAAATAYLKKHPWCECELHAGRRLGDGGARASDVHHKDGKGPRGPRGLDPTNFLALAHVCHSRITAEMQPGGFNRRDIDRMMRDNRAPFL